MIAAAQKAVTTMSSSLHVNHCLWRRLTALCRASFLVCLLGWSPQSKAEENLRAISVEETVDIFGFLLPPPSLDPSKIALGEKLFHDPRLSANNGVSCASCHIIASGGDDDRRFSIGVSGKPTLRNSPSVFNLDSHIAYFWDGRAQSLEDQIDGPIHHPDEMATEWAAVLEKLYADKNLNNLMRRLYGGVSERAVKDAIVQYQKSLVTNDSSFDAFMRGNEQALAPAAQRGLSRFIDYGCASCHHGPSLGGEVYQRFGLYIADERDGPLLKVPSLRNVALTAPYFHDGRTETLREAVETMAQAQLGRSINNDETADIVAFLHALSGARFTSQDISAKAENEQ